MPTWDTTLATGHGQIDEQHKALLKMIDDLNDAMKQGKGKDKLGEMLKFLAEYTVNHFKTEENLMQSTGFAGYAAHKKIHDEFVKQVQSTIKDFQEGRMLVSVQLSKMLNDWVIMHIKQVDRDYVPHLKSKKLIA